MPHAYLFIQEPKSISCRWQQLQSVAHDANKPLHVLCICSFYLISTYTCTGQVVAQHDEFVHFIVDSSTSQHALCDLSATQHQQLCHILQTPGVNSCIQQEMRSKDGFIQLPIQCTCHWKAKINQMRRIQVWLTDKLLSDGDDVVFTPVLGSMYPQHLQGPTQLTEITRATTCPGHKPCNQTISSSHYTPCEKSVNNKVNTQARGKIESQI